MSTDEPNTFDWDESLSMGLKWEERLSDWLETVLTRMSIENISFSDDPETQLSGIDSVLESGSANFDVKTQDHEYYYSDNLPIETMSVVEADKPGWFYTTESDIIVWVFPNQAGTNLMPTGYFLLHDDTLVEWFNENLSEFPQFEARTPRGETTWTTLGRLVPIDDIPASHITEFNPVLLEDEETDQGTLQDFLPGDGDEFQ